MAGERFRIDGTTYSVDALDNISLRDLMVFNTQVADMGLNIAWSDVERISGEMAAMAESSPGDTHPEALLMVGVTVWASRRAAGEDVTFEQAVDVPMSKIEWLEGPKDHQPKSGKKSGARKGSVRAVEPLVDEESTTPQTSSEPSANAS